MPKGRARRERAAQERAWKAGVSATHGAPGPDGEAARRRRRRGRGAADVDVVLRTPAGERVGGYRRGGVGGRGGGAGGAGAAGRAAAARFRPLDSADAPERLSSLRALGALLLEARMHDYNRARELAAGSGKKKGPEGPTMFSIRVPPRGMRGHGDEAVVVRERKLGAVLSDPTRLARPWADCVPRLEWGDAALGPTTAGARSRDGVGPMSDEGGGGASDELESGAADVGSQVEPLSVAAARVAAQFLDHYEEYSSFAYIPQEMRELLLAFCPPSVCGRISAEDLAFVAHNLPFVTLRSPTLSTDLAAMLLTGPIEETVGIDEYESIERIGDDAGDAVAASWEDEASSVDDDVRVMPFMDTMFDSPDVVDVRPLDGLVLDNTATIDTDQLLEKLYNDKNPSRLRYLRLKGGTIRPSNLIATLTGVANMSSLRVVVLDNCMKDLESNFLHETFRGFSRSGCNLKLLRLIGCCKPGTEEACVERLSKVIWSTNSLTIEVLNHR